MTCFVKSLANNERRKQDIFVSYQTFFLEKKINY